MFRFSTFILMTCVWASGLGLIPTAIAQQAIAQQAIAQQAITKQPPSPSPRSGQLQAQSNNSNRNSDRNSNRNSHKSKPVTFMPPPLNFKRGAPGNRGHNASRSGSGGEQALTTLVPRYLENQNNDRGLNITTEHVWSLTAVDRPVFWAYVPISADSSQQSLTFVLRDEAGRKLYEQAIAPPAQSGILRISTQDMAALEPGQRYHWFIKHRAIHNPSGSQIRDDDDGWIEYRPMVEPGAKPTTATSDWLAEADAYAQAGYWHEALDRIAQQQQQRPNDPDVQAAWKTLLEATELSSLSEAPLLPGTSINR